MKFHRRFFVFLFFALAALALAACGPTSTPTPTPFFVDTCGNGLRDSGEQCGEPDLSCPAGQNCNSDCQCDPIPVVDRPPDPESNLPQVTGSFGECGDGVVNLGEVCDGLRATSSGYPGMICAQRCDADGNCEQICNEIYGCGPDEYCSNDCGQCIPRPDSCGDGELQRLFEECEAEVCRPGTFGPDCTLNLGCDIGQVCNDSCACEFLSDAPPDREDSEDASSGGAGDEGESEEACKDATRVETYPVYDCTYDFDSGVWTYYEGKRCFDENGQQLFDGQTSGPITSTEWRGNCPSIFDEGGDDGGNDGGQQCDPQQQNC